MIQASPTIDLSDQTMDGRVAGGQHVEGDWSGDGRVHAYKRATFVAPYSWGKLAAERFRGFVSSTRCSAVRLQRACLARGWPGGSSWELEALRCFSPLRN